MNDFNPGDGWREITYQESVNGRRYLREHGDDGVPTHTWVHEEPVPSLPTEPYTVIRVTWADGLGHGNDAVRHLDGDWEGLDPVDLARRITGFEVLAVPEITALKNRDTLVRRETAKAVADWFAKNVPLTAVLYESALREFGVEVSS